MIYFLEMLLRLHVDTYNLLLCDYPIASEVIRNNMGSSIDSWAREIQQNTNRMHYWCNESVYSKVLYNLTGIEIRVHKTLPIAAFKVFVVF